jgi:hypothetical protein
MLFQHDPGRDMLVTLACRGSPRTGTGAEIVSGTGIADAATTLCRPVRISNMSRLRGPGSAIRDNSPSQEEGRGPLSGLPDAQRQIAVPMQVKGVLYAVRFAESPRQLVFCQEMLCHRVV